MTWLCLWISRWERNEERDLERRDKRAEVKSCEEMHLGKKRYQIHGVKLEL
ncbi:Uncharacterised protein [uncultured archaeon]|nr:Uncharacterised protein [uncultured archaeon]